MCASTSADREDPWNDQRVRHDASCALHCGFARDGQVFCYDADLLARPFANASGIDWIGTTAELLSFLAFFEGSPLAIKLVLSQGAALPKPGRLFMAVCTLYMTGYVAINSVRIVMDWLVHSPNSPSIDGMEPSLVGPLKKASRQGSPRT